MAKELLRNTNMKIYEIANEVGYHSVAYFNTIFKKITGYTPVEYKAKY